MPYLGKKIRIFVFRFLVFGLRFVDTRSTVQHWDCSAPGKLQGSGCRQLKLHWRFVHIEDTTQIVAPALARSQEESMKLDDLVFHVGRETLSKTSLRSHGDGVTTLPVGLPAKGRFKLGIGAEFFGLHSKHHAVD